MDFRIYKPECPTRHMKQWEARIPGNTQLVTQLKQVCRVVTQTQKNPHWQDFLKWPTMLGKIQRSTICPDSPGSCIPRKFVNHATKTMHIKELGSKLKHWTVFLLYNSPTGSWGLCGRWQNPHLARKCRAWTRHGKARCHNHWDTHVCPT